ADLLLSDYLSRRLHLARLARGPAEDRGLGCSFTPSPCENSHTSHLSADTGRRPHAAYGEWPGNPGLPAIIRARGSSVLYAANPDPLCSSPRRPGSNLHRGLARLRGPGTAPSREDPGPICRFPYYG